MRKLLYVPIIHSEPDLGSLGPKLAQETARLVGPGRWQKHREIGAQFWHTIAGYLLSLDISRLKIYQDGLAAGGELGRGVVEQAAKRGSPNYQLILELLNRGAELRKTEEASLLLAEQKAIAALDGMGKGELLEKRDGFIASTINKTLKDGEIAVLFIGAYHRVLPLLSPDIEVERVKEPEKVMAYFQALLQGEEKFQQLARYLASPIVASASIPTKPADSQ